MSNENEITDTPMLQNDRADAQEVLHEKLKRIANKAANRAAETEHRYDREHGLFTK